MVKRVLFLLNAALTIAILHLISQVHLSLFVKTLPKPGESRDLNVKISTFWEVTPCMWHVCNDVSEEPEDDIFRVKDAEILKIDAAPFSRKVGTCAPDYNVSHPKIL
jgi:hypothetical protein